MLTTIIAMIGCALLGGGTRDHNVTRGDCLFAGGALILTILVVLCILAGGLI